MDEIDFMEDAEMPDLNSTFVPDSSMITNQSLNRSGLVRISVSTNETYQQTDPVVIDQPKIRKKIRDCTEEIKIAFTCIGCMQHISRKILCSSANNM